MQIGIEFLTLLLGIPAGVVILMHFLEILGVRIWPLVVKVLNFKPFTCELCLTFWVHLVTAGLLNGFTIYNLLASFLAGFIGYLMSTKILKF
jgi:hypothetical protein